MSAGALAVTRALQQGQVAEQLDARRDRPDRRNIDMIVLLREFLSGFAEFGAARTVPGEEASRCVGILGQLARDARVALAPPLAPRRLGVRLLPARRRHRGIVRRLRRSAGLRFEFGDTGVLRLHQSQQFLNAFVPGGDLRNEMVDPRKQRRHQIGAISTRRIVLSLRHGERESACSSPLNTSDPSHNAAEG
jgi:hypothetical protein